MKTLGRVLYGALVGLLGGIGIVLFLTHSDPLTISIPGIVSLAAGALLAGLTVQRYNTGHISGQGAQHVFIAAFFVCGMICVLALLGNSTFMNSTSEFFKEWGELIKPKPIDPNQPLR